MELHEGDRFDHYLIESVLGRGGMGVVYVARDERLGRRVALKVLNSSVATDASFRARFQEEARIAASLDDPHVVPIFEAGDANGELFLTMRYVPGSDLDTLLRRQGPLPPERVVRIVDAVASALDAAHDAGLVHRDVKPANILLGSPRPGEEHVYLGDFGLTRSAGGHRLTRSGQFVGTFDYAAPEQIQDKSVDARTDVYALGGVLFTALTGRPPFEASSDVALLYAHVSADRPAPSVANPNVPSAFDPVVARAMATDPQQRYQSAGALAQAAREALSVTVVASLPMAEARAPADAPVEADSPSHGVEPGRSVDVPRSTEMRRTVTLMFTHLVGSTRGGEEPDPEALRGLLTRLFDNIQRIVERHGGVVEKFIGDAVLAVFGIPAVHEDDALRAVRAAWQIAADTERLNSDRAAELGVVLVIRTGICTGEVVAGDNHAGQHTVTGEPVNTAVRLQQSALPGQVVISEETQRLVRNSFTTDALPPVAPRGNERPVAAYAVASLAAPRRDDGEATPIVGRVRQMALLTDRWEHTLGTRSPRLVTLLGMPGVGKSRLAEELGASIEGRALVGRCLPYGDGVTYWPIREVVFTAAGVTEADSAQVAATRVAELFGSDPQAEVLAERVATAIGLVSADAPQGEVFWAVRRLFEQLARDTPTLIVIEDLGWAEDTLLDLLEYIVDLAADAPLMILATSRPEVLERRPGWSGALANAEIVRLDALTDGVTAELVRAQPGGSALPAELTDRIAAVAEGNPLFVQEMVASLREEGELRFDALGDSWSFAGDPSRVTVPPTIRALLSARIDRLPADDRLVVERASVAGRRFESDALALLVPADVRPRLGEHLRALVRRELIQPDRAELTATDAFQFRHILVRDTAYESLRKQDRAELHRRYAAWLESVVGDRRDELAEILGQHLELAHGYLVAVGVDDDRKALAMRGGDYLALAGSRADARGDVTAAEKLLARAVALLPEVSRQRLDARLALAAIQRRRGAFDVARESIKLSLAEADATGSSGGRARAELQQILIDIQVGAEDSILADRARLAEIRNALEGSSDSNALALLALAEGTIHETEGRNGAAARAFAEAVVHARSAEDRRLTDEALDRQLLNMILGETPVEQAIVRCEELIGESAGRPSALASMLDSHAQLLAMADRPREAIDAERTALAIAADLDNRLLEALYRSQELTVVLALASDVEGARAEGRRGCEGLLALGARAWLSTGASILGALELACTDPTEAQRWLEAADSASVASDIDARVRSTVLRARLALYAGDVGRAEALVADAKAALEGSELLYLRGIVATGEACVALAAGHADLARSAFEDAERIHERKGDVARAKRARALLEQPELASSTPLV